MEPTAYSSESSENKQALMFVGSFAFLLVLAGTFAYYFLFIGPYSGVEKAGVKTSSSYEVTPPPPTPTPTTNPWVIIKQAYANPFDEKTQYSNPFDQNKNPFDDLK